jgi:hypothetical protein
MADYLILPRLYQVMNRVVVDQVELGPHVKARE